MARQPMVVGEGINQYHFPSQQHLPVQFGPYTLWLQENKNRDIFDTTSTRLVSELPPVLLQQQQQQAMALPPQAPFVNPFAGPPPDVTYTYHPQAQEFVLRGFTANVQNQPPPQPPDTSAQLSALQYQIALKELERQGLETMMLHEQMLKHPYKLKFTENRSTLTDAPMTCKCCEKKKQKDVGEAMQVDEPKQCICIPPLPAKDMHDGCTQTDRIQFIVIPDWDELDEQADEDFDFEEDSDGEDGECFCSTDDDSDSVRYNKPQKSENNKHKGCLKKKKWPSMKKRIEFYDR